nr:translocation/assembly module TamB [Cytophagales bacterium]
MLSRIMLVLLLLFLFVAGLLQIPKVQTAVANYLTEKISARTGFQTRIKAVNIRWWDAISLDNVVVRDLQDSLMIDLDEVYIDFSIGGLLDRQNPGLDVVSLKNGNVRILTHSKGERMNILAFFEEIRSMLGPTKTVKDKKRTRFNVANIAFQNTSLDILNFTLTDTLPFDYGKLRFRNLNADADDFYVVADTVAFDLKNLQGEEATSGILFQQLRTDYTYSSTGMEFRDLFLKSNRTEIKNYLRFSYDSPASLNSFTTDVELYANLDESILDLQDLRYFSPNNPSVEDQLVLSGEISGKINELFSEQLLVRFGQRSALFGAFQIQGLPNVAETYFNLSLINSTLLSNDLTPYVSAAAQKELNKFREIRFDSDFAGFLTKFTANGDFRTGIGRMRGRVNYELKKDIPTYNGRIEAINVDIGVLMADRELFQKANFKGNIRGTGLNTETAIIELNADFKNIGINQYQYTNINTNATFGLELFKGQLSINDPNLVMEVDGTLDLRNNKDSANLTMRLDTAFLQALNLADRNVFLSGSFELDTKGIHWDDIEGVTRFRDVLVSYEGRDLFLDYFLFQSLFTDDSRVISLNSDLLVAGISGKFKVEELAKDVQELWEDYLLILTNESPPKRSYSGENEDYYIDIFVDLRDPNPIINLIAPNIYLSHQTAIEGAFYQTEQNTVFNFFSSIDTIYVDGNFFIDNNIDFNTSKRKNSSDVLASFYLFSKEQQLRSGINFHNFALEAIWNEDNVDLTLGIDQLATESYVRLTSGIHLEPGSTSIIVEPSEIKLLEDYWEFDGNNSIVIRPNELSFNNIRLFHENQYISAQGKINADPAETLDISIHELDLDFLNSFGLKSYRGTANGAITLTEYKRKEGSEGNLSIKDAYIDDFLIGDIEASAYYDEGQIHVMVDNYVDARKSIEILGTWDNLDGSLEMTASLNDTNLSIAEPFFGALVSELGGSVSGKLTIGGTLLQPEITGQALVKEGLLRFNYLNTYYQADGNVTMEPNQISFRGITLRDINNNNANLSGGITHDNFSNFIIDLTADFTNFQVLNTSLTDNELFYGAAFASGDLTVFGPLNNLEITANASSQPNTRVFIPIGSTQGQFQEDFIRIINVYDTLQFIEAERLDEGLALNNMMINLNLDLNPNAYVEIQIDPKTGETIQGRGRGQLNLNVDTQGNFNMYGSYEIVDALYNFSLYNIINKRFTIEPGGRISWFGDPYAGNMSIRAAYEENVSMFGLNANSSANEFQTAELKRRYPVKVIMDLEGQLLSPDISFAFDFSAFPEGSELQTTISAFQNRIANDEQEKNRQVFSLIMLRRFSPEGQFTGAGIGFSNLSQLISSQLNNLIAQVDQNLEIDFDLTSLDETALETFQLRVAYTFFDGRLRVARDGGFTDLQGNADFNTIAGDWQAEYLLTEDGRYRMRVYNRNNFNTLTALNINNRAPNTYGVSLSQNLLFSSFRELFQNFGRKSRAIYPFMDDDESLRYDFEIRLDDIAPELFRPDPLEERPAINILDKPRSKPIP